jgi:hypothetical protein
VARESRARVNAWHICQVGTTRVIGGVSSSIGESNLVDPFGVRG